MAKMIKKAQAGAKAQDSTKTYQDSPFQQAKQKNLKENEKQSQKQSVATPKRKMKNGGSLTGLKASTKRVGPVDPNGAWTKVQEKTLAGAKSTPKLVKDKQLGATKMTAKAKKKVSKKK